MPELLQLTHRKLPRNTIWCPLIRSLLTLQLGQDAPQNPGLLLHDWLFAAWHRVSFTGMSDHKGPCPRIMVLSCVNGGTAVHFSIATLTSRNCCDGTYEVSQRKQKSAYRFCGQIKQTDAPPGCLSLGPKVTLRSSATMELGVKHQENKPSHACVLLNTSKQLSL